MKTNLLSKLYLVSLSIGLVYSGFIQKNPMLKESQWYNVFSANAQEILSLFKIEGKDISNVTDYLLNGAGRVILTPAIQNEDSVFVPAEVFETVPVTDAAGVKGNRVK